MTPLSELPSSAAGAERRPPAPGRESRPSDPWPIGICMHPFRTADRDGVALHDAPAERWDEIFRDVSRAGFTALEIADSHIRPADLPTSRRNELVSIAADHDVRLLSVHVQRQSVIQSGVGEVNLAYAHRTIDTIVEMGMHVLSTGLHQPLTAAQRDATWFWTVPGHADPEDEETRGLAVKRLRELGRHAAEVGIAVSLEMYEDTYLGTADSAVRLIEEIGLDNVGLNPDIGNLIRLHRPIEDWRAAYEKTLPYANYWHMKNYTRDEFGGGQAYSCVPTSLELGFINYRDVVRTAAEGGFRGPFLMEHYGGDSLGVSATNSRYLQDLLTTAA